jgi:arginyl-tRNA synthetase
MKSREGTVVDADDLIDEVIQKAKEATMDRGHIDGMSEQEIDELCRMIGLGGLKYYLLKVDPKKRMLFNPEESIELNGNTGPFIQYAHARIKSILRKESAKGIHQNVALLDPEKEIIKLLAEAPKTLEEASLNMSPALIANYIYELVKAFNNFYQNVSIFKEENEEVKSNRLVLCQVVGDTIKDFMFLMGIDVPEKM